MGHLGRITGKVAPAVTPLGLAQEGRSDVWLQNPGVSRESTVAGFSSLGGRPLQRWGRRPGESLQSLWGGWGMSSREAAERPAPRQAPPFLPQSRTTPLFLPCPVWDTACCSLSSVSLLPFASPPRAVPLEVVSKHPGVRLWSTLWCSFQWAV